MLSIINQCVVRIAHPRRGSSVGVIEIRWICFFYRIIAQIFRNTYVSTSAGSFLIRHHAAVEKQFLVCFEACRSRCRRDPLSDECNVFYFFVGYMPEEIRRQMIITVSLDRLSVYDCSYIIIRFSRAIRRCYDLFALPIINISPPVIRRSSA